MMKYFRNALLILFFSSIIISVWFFHGSIMGTGESGLLFYKPHVIYELFKDAWSRIYLGNVNGINVASAPTLFLFSVFETYGVPNFIIQALFFLFLFFIASYSVFLLTKELFPKLETKYLYISAIFYVFNPISLINVWNRFLYNYMSFWALLPLLLWLFIKGLKTKKYFYSLSTALVTIFFSFALSSTVFNILLWALLLYAVLFFFLIDLKNLKFYISYFCLSLLLYSLFNLWWISQFFNFIFSSSFSTNVDKFFTTEGNLSGLSSISQRLGSLIDVLRFSHTTFLNDGPSWVRIYTSPLVVFIEFLITGLILWTIYKLKSNKNILFLGILFTLSIFLMKGNNPPFGEIFQFFFEHFTFLQVFRNPFEKFGFLLLPTAAPLFAISLDQIVKKIKSEQAKKIIIYSFCIFLLGIWGLPFLTGLVFTYQNENVLKSFRVSVPEYYSKVDNFIKKQTPDTRLLILPLGGEGITQAWQNPYSGVEISSNLFHNSSVSLNTTIPFFDDFSSEVANNQLSKNILNLLPFMNAQFIVWRGDIDFKQRKFADPEKIKQRLDEWSTEGLLTKKLEDKKIAVYQVSKNNFWPKLYITSSVLTTNKSDILSVGMHNPQLFANKSAIVDSQSLPPDYKNLLPDLIMPSRVYSPSLKEFQKYSDEDLLARLFYVNHLPTDRLYFLYRIKEVIEIPFGNDPINQLIYSFGLLGKRTVEIYKMRKAKVDAKVITEYEKMQNNEFKKLTPKIFELSKNNDQISDTLITFLFYQYTLLQRVNSPVAETIHKILVDAQLTTQYSFPSPGKDGYLIYAFNIPNNGNYSIEFPPTFKAKKWYMDGKVIASLENSDNKSLYLSTGPHELAILVQESAYKVSNVVENQLLVSKKNPKSLYLNLSDTPSTYEINFDFRFTKGNIAKLEFLQDIDEKKSPLYENQITRYKKQNKWNHMQGKFTSSSGASNGNFIIKSNSEKVCNMLVFITIRCYNVDRDFEVEIKNLTIKQITYPDTVLISDKTLPSNQSSIKWNKINDTFYTVIINKQQNNPEVLAFSELFNSGWVAESDGKQLQNHILINTFANGWLIDKSGNYKIDIKFLPQNILDKTRVVSLYSTLVGIILLLLLLWKKKY